MTLTRTANRAIREDASNCGTARVAQSTHWLQRVLHSPSTHSSNAELGVQTPFAFTWLPLLGDEPRFLDLHDH